MTIDGISHKSLVNGSFPP